MDGVTSIHSTDGNLDNMSEIMSVAMTDDKESTVGTIGPAAIPNPEIEHVREVIVKMKETLGTLGVSSLYRVYEISPDRSSIH
jgi:hypothetical protein